MCDAKQHKVGLNKSPAQEIGMSNSTKIKEVVEMRGGWAHSLLATNILKNRIKMLGDQICESQWQSISQKQRENQLIKLVKE